MSEIQGKTKSFADYLKSLGAISAGVTAVFLAGAAAGPKLLTIFGAPETLSGLEARLKKLEGASAIEFYMGAIQDNANWKATEINFPNTEGEKEISRTAEVCALTGVDDDTPGGSCRVWNDNGIWKAQSGGNGSDNWCAATCLELTLPAQP